MATSWEDRRMNRVAVLTVGILMAGAPVANARPAAEVPLTAWRLSSLKQHFADTRHTTVRHVEELGIYDLKQARGVLGFTLGRFRSKNGRWSRGGMVVYRPCGKKVCFSSMALETASKVRAVRLVDLSAKEDRIAFGTGSWFPPRRGRVKEPPKRARWPVLVVQTEHLSDDQRLKRQLYLVSLKDPDQPAVLVSLTTLSTRKGEIGRTRRGFRRFNGTKVTGLRLVRERGKPLRMEVTEERISTRFNRCKKPKPVPVVYEMKEGRFVQQPREHWSGACP
jgi:hypothetical protein